MTAHGDRRPSPRAQSASGRQPATADRVWDRVQARPKFQTEFQTDLQTKFQTKFQTAFQTELAKQGGYR
jgi:hypothetical protein